MKIGDLVKWNQAKSSNRYGIIVKTGKEKQDFNLKKVDYVDVVWSDGRIMRAFANTGWWRALEVVANA